MCTITVLFCMFFRCTTCRFLLWWKPTCHPHCVTQKLHICVLSQLSHMQENTGNSSPITTICFSHHTIKPFKYLSATQLAIRLKHSQHQCRLASKQISRLQEKISRATVENRIVVDDEMHCGLQEMMCTETSEVYRKYKQNTFHHLFWKQQMDAASRQDARGMHWHPAMTCGLD